MKKIEVLKINYGLNRGKGSNHRHRYGKIEVVGDWEDDETQREIRRRILDRHPGWFLTGYALIESVKPEEPISEKAELAREIQARMVHFYGQTDGTMKFPSSAEGDLLKMVHKLLKRDSSKETSDRPVEADNR